MTATTITRQHLQNYQDKYIEITAAINDCNQDEVIPDHLIADLLNDHIADSPISEDNVGKDFFELMKAGAPPGDIIATFVPFFLKMDSEAELKQLVEAFEYFVNPDVFGTLYLKLMLPALPDLEISMFKSGEFLHSAIRKCLRKCWEDSMMVTYIMSKFGIGSVALSQVLHEHMENSKDFRVISSCSPQALRGRFSQIEDPEFYRFMFKLFLQHASPEQISESLKQGLGFSLNFYEIGEIADLLGPNLDSTELLSAPPELGSDSDDDSEEGIPEIEYALSEPDSESGSDSDDYA